MTPKVKLSEVQCAVMDELRRGEQTVQVLADETGRRVTWVTMAKLQRLGVVGLDPISRRWFLTGAAASTSEEPKNG